MLSQISRLNQYEPQPSLNTSPFLNEQILLSAALAASHSYPPPTSFFSNSAASNLLSSIHAHFNSVTTPTNNYFDDQTLPTDVKNLIGSSLTAIGLDDLVDEKDVDTFEQSTTPTTNNTSPANSTSQRITRPMNIPNSFSTDYFSQSSSAKSPFDAPNQLFDESIQSVIKFQSNKKKKILNSVF